MMKSLISFKVLHQECDEIIYRHAYAGQTKNEDGSLTYNEPELVYYHVDQFVDSLKMVADSLMFWLSPADGSNFRFKSATIKGPCGQGYKAGRQPKPKLHGLIRNYFKSQYNAMEIQGYEADDALGMCQSSGCVLSHIDKDIDMIPGWHYNYIKKELYHHEDDFGDLELEGKKLKGSNYKFFYSQLLTGDRVDNIPGIKGVGPKKVFDLLFSTKNHGEALAVVTNCYKRQYRDFWREALLEVSDLLWICRKPQQTGKIIVNELLENYHD